MSYLVLECPVDSSALARYQPDDDLAENWHTGARFVVPPAEPLRLTWDATTEHGERAAFYEHGPVLMRSDAVAAFRECGVTNLDSYGVVIRSPSGQPDCLDYLAVNVLGLIAAVDMGQSRIEDESDGMFDVLFESIVIDPNKARGQLLFRLAESIRTIVVHESVVNRLVQRGGYGLAFTETELYSG